MNRTALPVRVHIVAKVLDHFRHLMCTDRLMLAAANTDSGWSPCAGIMRNALKRESVEVQQMRWPESEWALWM
jgi:hypothetical protein